MKELNDIVLGKGTLCLNKRATLFDKAIFK